MYYEWTWISTHSLSLINKFMIVPLIRIQMTFYYHFFSSPELSICSLEDKPFKLINIFVYSGWLSLRKKKVKCLRDGRTMLMKLKQWQTTPNMTKRSFSNEGYSQLINTVIWLCRKAKNLQISVLWLDKVYFNNLTMFSKLYKCNIQCIIIILVVFHSWHD